MALSALPKVIDHDGTRTAPHAFVSRSTDGRSAMMHDGYVGRMGVGHLARDRGLVKYVFLR